MKSWLPAPFSEGGGLMASGATSTTFLTMPNDRDVQRALDAGARRSREACQLSPSDQAFIDSLTTPAAARFQAALGVDSRYHFSLEPRPRESLTPEVLWRRFKWIIIPLGMFGLLEILSLSKLISVMGTHF